MKAIKTIAYLAIVYFAWMPFAHSMSDFIEVKVCNFCEVNENEFVLTFKIIATNQKQIVHIRYNPEATTVGAQDDKFYSKNSYLEAIQLLKKQVETSNRIILSRKSGRGYNPIKGMAGHFQCEVLQVLKINDQKYVHCIHGDR